MEVIRLFFLFKKLFTTGPWLFVEIWHSIAYIRKVFYSILLHISSSPSFSPWQCT